MRNNQNIIFQLEIFIRACRCYVKNGILHVLNMLCHVMEIFCEVNGILWFEKLWKLLLGSKILKQIFFRNSKQ